MVQEVANDVLVKNWIHNRFSNNKIECLAEKMLYIKRPFYKYCSVLDESSEKEGNKEEIIDYSINNFKDEILYFNSPSRFNDPFDCYLGFSLKKALTEKIISNLEKQQNDTPENRQKFENSLSELLNGKKAFANAEEATFFYDGCQKLNSVSSIFRDYISRSFKISCLSERMDSSLMWSHYASKHAGFCLEYDFSLEMENSSPDLKKAILGLFPVVYSEERPLIPNQFLDSGFLNEIENNRKTPDSILEDVFYGLLVKSIDWSYEKEWRIIIKSSLLNDSKLKIPPRKVFLGANIKEKTKEKLLDIARIKHIPAYQMRLSLDKYRLEYSEIV